jgi:hypothetical protein
MYPGLHTQPPNSGMQGARSLLLVTPYGYAYCSRARLPSRAAGPESGPCSTSSLRHDPGPRPQGRHFLLPFVHPLPELSRACFLPVSFVETNTGTFCSFIFLQKPGNFFCLLLFSRSFGWRRQGAGFRCTLVIWSFVLSRPQYRQQRSSDELRYVLECPTLPTCFSSFACAAASQGGGNSGSHDDE